MRGLWDRSWMRWGRYRRQVRDVRVEAVTVERWKCQVCGQTVRVYPEGWGGLPSMGGPGMGAGAEPAGGGWWMEATAGLGLWRDVQEVAAAGLRRRLGRVQVLGVDGTGVRYGGRLVGWSWPWTWGRDSRWPRWS